MVDDVVYIVGLEFVQDRYYDGSVGKSSEKCDGPMRGVTAADGYFISFFYAGRLHQDMHLFYFAGNVFITVRNSFEIAQCGQFPVVANGVFDICVETFVHYDSDLSVFSDEL